MKTYLFLLFVLTSNACLAFSSCTDKKECWPEESANYTALAFSEEIAEIEKKISLAALNLTHQMENFQDDGGYMKDVVIPAFSLQQSEWGKYVQYQCGLLGVITPAMGSWPSARILECERNEKKIQLDRLISTSRCIDRYAKPGEVIEKRSCLNMITGSRRATDT